MTSTNTRQRSVIMTGSWKNGAFSAQIQLPANHDADELELMMSTTRDLMGDVLDFKIKDDLMQVKVGIEDNGDLQVEDLTDDIQGVLVMIEALLQNIEQK